MLEINPRWWIGKDSLGIVYDVTHCYNLEKKWPSSKQITVFLHTNSV